MFRVILSPSERIGSLLALRHHAEHLERLGLESPEQAAKAGELRALIQKLLDLKPIQRRASDACNFCRGTTRNQGLEIAPRGSCKPCKGTGKVPPRSAKPQGQKKVQR